MSTGAKWERWGVELRIERPGEPVIVESRTVEIVPPFGIKCADAEVQAIREAERANPSAKVQALRSWFLDSEWPGR